MEIDAFIAVNEGSSYGIVSAKVNQHKRKLTWVNRDLLYNYRKQATIEIVLPPHEILLYHQSTCITNPMSQLTTSITDAEFADNGSTTDHQDEPEDNLTSTEESRNFGGRPKGTTNEALRDLKFKEKLALNWAAVEFEKAKEKGRSQWGIYDRIIKEANKKFDLPEKYCIKKQTVHSRLPVSRKTLVANHGFVSPMIRMEGYFVNIFFTLSAMRQPSNETEGVQLINSMVKRTFTEKEVRDWKKKHLKLDCAEKSISSGTCN